ncbi:TonB-dependent receptor [Rhodoplanes sp.]|uniref:TonB-dependent receptor n=1 Tax=Rhodoplanes sp. TaxID=1968906 RepID=UPI0025F16FF6|nr:TonB-dependent receptor plug domain-containing protein [Rhodoplanes sp.]
MLTTALLSPTLALATVAAMPQPARAQTATVVPPVTVETEKPKPRPQRSRAATSRRAAPATPVPAAVAPSPAGPAGGAATASGPSVPVNTATISAAGAFSRALGTSDTASLIDLIPGGATWGAGGVSSLPAINGQGADRVQVAVNGMLLGPACPNEMNPPLSFVNPAQISNLKAYVGVSPVSVGGDYTAGKVVVETAAPQFAPTSALVTSATVSGFYRSINNSYGADANASIANADTAVTYAGGWVKASDYKAADGTKVKSTLYEMQNHALTIAKRTLDSQYTVQIGGQFIPYQGYVNQWMDMVYNRGLFANGKYEGRFDWGNLEATAFVHQTRHTMGFIEPDKTGNMPMDTRSLDTGYSVKAIIPVSQQDLLRVGNELNYNHLDDWWDPVPGSMMMSPNVFWNINDGRRARVGTFVEWERRWSRDWTTVIGLRNDIVAMNTGPVQGYNMMMYGADATAFNKLDRGRTDVNIDGSALLRYTPDDWSVYEVGVARKTRSPNLYERYTWSTNMMAMSMIGWFGDGNGYVGNVDLVPEKAHTASFTLGWHDLANKVWEVKVTPYYTYVQDYIDVDRCPVKAGSMTCSAMNQTTTNNFVYLQFANHDAWLAGVNLAGKVAVWDDLAYGRGVLRGTLGYVRGQRTDGINLYHVMPINGRIGLDHTLGGWTNSVEVQLVGTKNEVSEVRNELTTPGYALVNIRTGYQWKNVRIDAGIDNLFNKYYWLPLGGANLVNYDGAWGYSVLGPGRSFNSRLTVTF